MTKYLPIISLLIFISCHSKNGPIENAHAISMEAEEPPSFAYRKGDLNFEEVVPPQSPQIAPPEVELMIIKNGRIKIQTEALKSSKSLIDSLVKGSNAYFQSEDYYSWDHESGYNMVMRIPSSGFDNFINQLASGKAGKIIEKDINSREVSEEYIDLEMRLANSESYLERYLTLLDRADSIKDMLVIQEKVRILEEEIEARKGRMRYLSNQVTMSTLSISLVEYHPILAEVEKDHFGKKIANSFIGGFNGVLEFLIGIVAIWPLLLFIVGLFILGRWFLKRRASLS